MHTEGGGVPYGSHTTRDRDVDPLDLPGCTRLPCACRARSPAAYSDACEWMLEPRLCRLLCRLARPGPSNSFFITIETGAAEPATDPLPVQMDRRTYLACSYVAAWMALAYPDACMVPPHPNETYLKYSFTMDNTELAQPGVCQTLLPCTSYDMHFL